MTDTGGMTPSPLPRRGHARNNALLGGRVPLPIALIGRCVDVARWRLDAERW
jgi:hypothetical protein